MADLCPSCLRPIATRHTELEPGLCTKRLGDELWRRTECSNTGIAARDAKILHLEATLKGQAALLARARESLTYVQQRVDQALEDFCREDETGQLPGEEGRE